MNKNVLTSLFTFLSGRSAINHPSKIVTTPVLNKENGQREQYEAYFQHQGPDKGRYHLFHTTNLDRIQIEPENWFNLQKTLNFLATQELTHAYKSAGIKPTGPLSYEASEKYEQAIDNVVKKFAAGQKNNPDHLYQICETHPLERATHETIDLCRLIRLLERNEIIPPQQSTSLKALLPRSEATNPTAKTVSP